MEVAVIAASVVVVLVIGDLIGVVMGITSPVDEGWIDAVDDE